MRLVLLCLCLLALGCSPTGGTHTDDPPTAPVVPDPPAGPHLRVTAVAAGSKLHVTVKTYGLGDVFGVSYHLVTDPNVLTVSGLENAQPPFLGMDNARHVLVARGGDLSAGGSTRQPSLGNVTLADGTTVLETDYQVLAAGVTSVRVERVVVKRADGTAVPAVGTSYPVAVTP